MVQEEIFLRLLQAGTALSTVTLLITCMSMHNVKWWLPIPIYFLMFSCLVTFLTTFFMRIYVFEATVVTIFLLGVSGSATALHAFLQPVPPNRKEATNRRVLYFALPLMGFLFTVWCIGATYEGGIGFLQRFDKKLNNAIDNQEELMTGIESTKEDIKDLNGKFNQKDAKDSAYRAGLDKRMEELNSRLTDQSLRMHRLTLDQQKANQRKQ
ncbi:hypothetical protein [Spirosoma sp.]|uniref:hypothetical protein n=1 Tax=Spirosoma sp. TaxID=1899569 RepID=UPI0026342605|nr:hypothetical protein [Spirosoma sp.]MCX6218324.1 hypothetical protein [Spirosoma sp.]